MWNTINQWIFYQILECQSPWTNVKPSNWKLCGDGSVGNEQRQGITLCTCDWKRCNPKPRKTKCASHNKDCKLALLNRAGFMGVWRGVGGPRTPGFWKLQQKRLFSKFRVAKNKFYHFWSPLENLLRKSLYHLPKKNPSDAHGRF